MIKKLKKRFIIICMCSVSAVLLLLIGSINIVNYTNVIQSATMRLDMLENVAGKTPILDFFGFGTNPLSPEAPFETRYFYVLLDFDGNIISVDTSNIAAVNTDEAVKMTDTLFRKGKSEGITGHYAYRALTERNTIRYIFLDHSRELSTFYMFLYASALISLLSLGVIFILILIFSKYAIRPIAQSYEKQKRFITDAGHELKTPLSVIKAANEVLEIQYGESKWTDTINHQVSRMSELTNKLVILSRMSEDKGVQKIQFSISDTLKECISYFEAVEYSADKFIISDIEENINYTGDEKAIAQLFSLLTDNALKYSPTGSEIRISLRKTNKGCEISFLNPCENVPEGNNNVLFERFYRHDNSRNSESGGHGIGLSVAKAITDAHKGKISAVSPDGRSFRITVNL